MCAASLQAARRSRLSAGPVCCRTVALLVAVVTGCRAPGYHPTTQPTVAPESNAELIEQIGNLPYLTAEPGYRAVYILWRGEPFAGDFDALAAELKAGGIASQAWRHRSDTFLDRAAVGYLVARACGIRTGLNWQLTGLGRYAYRELVYRGIAHPRSEWSLISGGEFLGILSRAEEYLQQVGRAPVRKAELGPAQRRPAETTTQPTEVEAETP